MSSWRVSARMLAAGWPPDRARGEQMTQPTPDREREALLEWLGDQRSHVLGVIKGLSEEKLRQPVLPSGWSCLAMVRHLAVDDERFWFRAVAAGEALDLNDDTGWQPSPDEPAEPCSTCTGRRPRPPTRSWPGSAWTRRPPDGRTTSAAGGSVTCGRSSCTSSPRLRSMPGTSTLRANCSTAAPGWARTTRGSRATERAPPGTREHARNAARGSRFGHSAKQHRNGRSCWPARCPSHTKRRCSLSPRALASRDAEVSNGDCREGSAWTWLQEWVSLDMRRVANHGTKQRRLRWGRHRDRGVTTVTLSLGRASLGVAAGLLLVSSGAMGGVAAHASAVGPMAAANACAKRPSAVAGAGTTDAISA